MKLYMLGGIICTVLGVILGISAYKKLHPTLACPALTEAKTDTETHTIIRYKDSRGAPVEKETTVTKKEQLVSAPLPARPKNILGISGRLTPQGDIKIGPVYGRELFPSTYVTGGILISPQGKPAPEVQLGIQFQF